MRAATAQRTRVYTQRHPEIDKWRKTQSRRPAAIRKHRRLLRRGQTQSDEDLENTSALAGGLGDCQARNALGAHGNPFVQFPWFDDNVAAVLRPIRSEFRALRYKTWSQYNWELLEAHGDDARSASNAYWRISLAAAIIYESIHSGALNGTVGTPAGVIFTRA